MKYAQRLLFAICALAALKSTSVTASSVDLRPYLMPVMQARSDFPAGTLNWQGFLMSDRAPVYELVNMVFPDRSANGTACTESGNPYRGETVVWVYGFGLDGTSTPENSYEFRQRYPSPYPDQPLVISYSLRIGEQLQRTAVFKCFSTEISQWRFTDTFTFGNIVRRKGLDGSEFDALPMKVMRNGEAWETIYFGYRLGPIEARGNWSQESLARVPELVNWPVDAWPDNNEVALKSLPPPWIEGEVTEYLNTDDFPKAPYGQFFYAATNEDRSLLDKHTKWMRTGRSFFSGGYVGVCRFYGSVTPGPNTHFFTASAEECDYFKNLQKIPAPTDVQQLNYEGQPFRASLPITKTLTSSTGVVTESTACPKFTVPLHRAYNNAYSNEGKRDYDSNHRFSTERRDMDTVVAQGWVYEGVVMCVPEMSAQRLLQQW